ncbi:hypothetical protein [Streptomyces sp. NPDC101165]|uniref:hypothetical protein n=1 Tax=Streptomyces sp. NPDC101165 TaxID=3366119 RepID=UPI0037FD6A8F
MTGMLVGARTAHIGLRTRNAWKWDDHGWRPDGFYHYLGSSYSRHNDRLVAEAEQGKPIHLFEMGGQVYRYIDEFTLEDVDPPVTLPDHSGNPVCVPVFRLRPTEAVAHVPGQLESFCDPGVITLKPVEQSALMGSSGAARQRLRPENELVLRFCEFLESRGHPSQRIQIRHTADHAPMFTDIWVDSALLLIEAKVRPERREVSNAIGQMADYTRFLPNPQRAILLSGRPDGDVIELAHAERCAVIWPAQHNGWQSSVGWLDHLGIRLAMP